MRTNRWALGCALTILAALALRGAPVVETREVKDPPKVGNAPIDHIGVVVRDLDATLKQYVRVMGFAVPETVPYHTPVPDGRRAEFKLATLAMPNFHIELFQPVNAVGPYHDHLRTYGMSIQHAGFVNPGTGSVDEMRDALERQGGRWTFGASHNRFAYVNFQSTLGTTFELLRGGHPPAVRPRLASAEDVAPPLARLKVTHVGLAVTDVASVTKHFSGFFGVPLPTVVEYKDAQYPPDSTWNRKAYLRLASWNQGGMGVEVIESVDGPTPWSEFIGRQKGSGLHHLAIDVGNRMDEMIRDLQAKGGKWTNGKPGGSYAYLDFMDTLGLVLELNGSSKSAPSSQK